MKNLFYRLIMFIDNVDENDLNYKIAYYMVQNFNHLGDMRISELAQECYVSAATISRFCRELGFDNYAELKEECMNTLEHEHKLGNLIRVSPEIMLNQPEKATEIFVNQLCSDLQQLPKVLDWQVIDQVLKLIHDTDDVHFFGIQFSNCAAAHLQGDLMLLKKFTHASIDVRIQEEYAKKMTEDSLAIVMSVKGNYLYRSGAKTLKYLERSGCKVVFITALEEKDLPIPADYIISLGDVLQGQSGKHAMLAVVEMMALRYYTLHYPSFELLQKNIDGTN